MLAVVAVRRAGRAMAGARAQASAGGSGGHGRPLSRDRPAAGVRRGGAAGWAGLRPHEPADDRHAARDGLLQPAVRAGGAGDPVARRRHVRARLRHRHADRPLRRAAGDPGRRRRHGRGLAGGADRHDLTHFVVALVLVGVGWNFMYTGGTTLLTEAYTPAEKARTQGANDFIVFSVMAVSSFSSGALVSSAGWEVMNWRALPVLALIAGVVLWYSRTHDRRQRRA